MKDDTPAFPITDTTDYSFLGLTMRDYFAAKVLQGMLSGETHPDAVDGLPSFAYMMADLMMEARK